MVTISINQIHTSSPPPPPLELPVFDPPVVLPSTGVLTDWNLPEPSKSLYVGASDEGRDLVPRGAVSCHVLHSQERPSIRGRASLVGGVLGRSRLVVVVVVVVEIG